MRGGGACVDEIVLYRLHIPFLNIVSMPVCYKAKLIS